MAGRDWIVIPVALLAAFAGGVIFGENRVRRNYKPEVVVEYRTDTITRTTPVYIASRPVIRYDTLRMPAETLLIRVPDTIVMPIPIEQRVYADSHYRAVVSGWHPSLDSISVYERTRTITRVVPDSRRWGLGVQAGVGFSPAGVQPYVGLGVSYNLLSW